MEINSIPFLNQDEYSYFYSFFQELDSTNTITEEISPQKRRKLHDSTPENTFFSEILNTISLLEDREAPDSNLGFNFQIPSWDSENRASEMADLEQGRVRKSPPPKFHGGATVAEDGCSTQCPIPACGGGPRRLWVKERSNSWWEFYNSDECSDEEFRKAFRMGKATFKSICDDLESAVTKKDTMLRTAIPCRQRVAVCLYRLATGEPLRTVSSLFGLGISTCHKLVLDVCAAILNVLMPKSLQWPTDDRLARIKNEFATISGIPDVGGSIYTTHVSIIAPKTTPAAYFNKKHTEKNQKPSYTTTVQGVVDARGVFTDVCIGYPGSMPDHKILEKSALFRRSQMGVLQDTWIVGNKGYPLRDWMLVPYTHQNQTWAQHGFNQRVGVVQKIGEDAFMRLKGRWGCLQKRTEMKLQDLPVVLGACCVLHNICELNGDAMDGDLRFDLVDDEMVLGEDDRGKSVNALQARDVIAHNILHHSHGGSAFR